MTLDFRPASEEIYTITQSTPEVLAGEMWLGPGADGPPLHIHPQLKEELELLEGKLRIYKDGRWETIDAGTSWVVHPGEVHTFKAEPSAEARVKFRITPSGGFLGFLTDSHRLIQSGKMTSYESLNGLIYSSMIVKKYSDDFRAAQPGMRLVMSLANLVGRLSGKRV